MTEVILTSERWENNFSLFYFFNVFGRNVVYIARKLFLIFNLTYFAQKQRPGKNCTVASVPVVFFSFLFAAMETFKNLNAGNQTVFDDQ